MFVAFDPPSVQPGIVAGIESPHAERTAAIACLELETVRAEVANVLVVDRILWRWAAIKLVEDHIFDRHVEIGGRKIKAVGGIVHARFEIARSFRPQTGLQDVAPWPVLEREAIADFLAAKGLAIAGVHGEARQHFEIGAEIERKPVAAGAATIRHEVEIVSVVADAEADQQRRERTPVILQVDPDQLAAFFKLADVGIPGPVGPHLRIFQIPADDLVGAIFDARGDRVVADVRQDARIAAPGFNRRPVEPPAVEPIDLECRARPVSGAFEPESAATVETVVCNHGLSLRVCLKQRIAGEHRPVGTRSELAFLIAVLVAHRETVAGADVPADFDEAELLRRGRAENFVAVTVLEGIAVGIDVGTDHADLATEPTVQRCGQLVAVVGEPAGLTHRAYIAAGREQVGGVSRAKADRPADRAESSGGLAGARLQLDRLEQLRLDRNAADM